MSYIAKDRDKEREHHRFEEAVQHYKALLTDLVSEVLSSKSSWCLGTISGHSFINNLFCPSIDWLIVRLIDWLFVRLIDWLSFIRQVHWLIDCRSFRRSIDWLIDWDPFHSGIPLFRFDKPIWHTKKHGKRWRKTRGMNLQSPLVSIRRRRFTRSTWTCWARRKSKLIESCWKKRT